MVDSSTPRYATSIHPVHVVLVSCTLSLFLGGLLADVAYACTYQVQWLNFAAWLIAGAMVFTGLALAWWLLEAFRTSFREKPLIVGLLLFAAMFVLGLLNCFMHARDAWGSMPGGLVLSLIVTALALVATGLSVLAPRSRSAT